MRTPIAVDRGWTSSLTIPRPKVARILVESFPECKLGTSADPMREAILRQPLPATPMSAAGKRNVAYCCVIAEQ